MNPYFGKIEELTLQNANFRQVLYTGQHAQLVVMSLKPGEEIGAEVHDTVDQFFRIEAGQGKVVVGENEDHLVADGDAIVIPAGTRHNVINVSTTEDLKLYTIYSPPNHPDGTVHVTKAEADAAEAEHNKTTGSMGPVSDPAVSNEPTPESTPAPATTEGNVPESASGQGASGQIPTDPLSELGIANPDMTQTQAQVTPTPDPVSKNQDQV